MLSRKNKELLLWWTGVPIVILFLILGPHWAWNIFYNQQPWWRVPIIGQMMFDVGAYLEWIGSTVTGIEYGGHIGWFENIIRLFASILPKDISVAELWFITRWISLVAAIWVGAWLFRIGALLEKKTARNLSVLFFISTWLVLGMRPAVYSWFLPFGFISIIACLSTGKHLREQRIGRAVAWSAVAWVAASIYIWFFIFFTLWTISLWTVWLIEKSRRMFYVIFVLATIGVGFLIPLLPYVIQTPAAKIFYESYVRHGLSFTHLPLISNSFIVMLVWIFFCSWLIPRATEGVLKKRLEEIHFGWIVLLLAWLLSSFTGVYIHNDHFRTPVLFLSWLTFAILWNSKTENFLFTNDKNEACKKRAVRILPLIGTIVISGYFSFSYIVKPFTFDGDFLNIIHLSHWIVLFLASTYLYVLWTGLSLTLLAKRKYILLLTSVAMGAMASISAYQREFKRLPDLIQKVPIITWVQNNVPSNEAICADPKTADELSPHLKRRLYLTQQSFLLKESHVDAYNRLIVFLSAYDATGAGQEEAFEYFLNGAPASACTQFSRFEASLHLLGIAPTKINSITGCDKTFLEQNKTALKKMFSQKTVQPNFSVTCPWIIIPQDVRQFWRIPNGYSEHPVTPTISVWEKPR